MSGGGGKVRSSGPADPKLAGFLVSRSKELMSDVTGGDQSRGLKAGGVIYTRDKIQNKKEKKRRSFLSNAK